MTTQHELRAQVRAEGLLARRSLSPAERALRNGRLASHLLLLPELAHTPTLATYAPGPHEASPTVAVHALHDRGSRVLYPRVKGTLLELVEVDDPTDLVAGFRDIAEPVGPATDPADIDVIIVPGVAFDLRGNRIGQGGGHYDRLLPTLPEDAVRVGLAYGVQVIGAVPREDHDAVVDIVVTEDGAVRTMART